jgi:hypothetical protein
MDLSTSKKISHQYLMDICLQVTLIFILHTFDLYSKILAIVSSLYTLNS